MIWASEARRRVFRAFALLGAAAGAVSALLSVFDGNWDAMGASLMALGWALLAWEVA